MHALANLNTELLGCIDELLDQLSDAELSARRTLLFGSSIGGHFRHILEFYACLLGNAEAGRFSYDLRQRDPMLEGSVALAQAAARQSIEQLARLPADRSLCMTSELPGESAHIEQRTTLARELAYLADHSVHHLAMVRIVLEQELSHVRFANQLGVAASTRNHQKKLSIPAR